MRDKIIRELSELCNNPYPSHCKKLAGRPGWRIRIGDYRVIYSVDQKKREVMVLAIAHRREVYR